MIFLEIKRSLSADDPFAKKSAGYFGHSAQLQTDKRTKQFMGKIIEAMRDLPHLAQRSITFDRGTEFVSWLHLRAGIGVHTWFYNSLSPWQKGTAENTNRHTLSWLPRKRDIKALTDHDLKMISDRIKSTARKCLECRTPAEVFIEKMM